MAPPIKHDPFVSRVPVHHREIQETYETLLTEIEARGNGVSEMQRQLAQRASTIGYLIRRLEAKICWNEKTSEMDLFLKMVATHKRLLESLGSKAVQAAPVKRDGKVEFHEYLENVRARQNAVNEMADELETVPRKRVKLLR